MSQSWAESGTYAAALGEEDTSALIASARRRRYPRGTTLFTEGDSSDRVLLLTEGRVKISSFTDDGREVVLAVRGAGDLVGDMSAIDRGPRLASAYALEDVEAAIIPATDFMKFLEDHPRASLALLQMFVARQRDADEKRIEYLAQDTIGRVASRLVELADRYGADDAGSVRIDLPLTQEELAGWIGASREAVSKALQMLRGRDWIETHRRGITVLDLDALRRRAI